MPDPTDPSPAEKLKLDSDHLRGDLARELIDLAEPFTPDAASLLKHHGMYQQVDRDRRRIRGTDGSRAKRIHSLMVRVKIPCGHLRPEQLVGLLDLADESGDATLRITSRQDLQLHGVLKRDARRVVRSIDALGLTTLGACGDVGRNVMCCPGVHRQDPVHEQMRELAGCLTQLLHPQSGAYRDVWFSDTPLADVDADRPPEAEPLYGDAYLPRKFKVGIALPGDNCSDVFTQDVGLLAVCEEYQVIGYELHVGGGMGVTPRRDDTFPALAQPMAFTPPDEVLDVVRAIVETLRDRGDRTDRRRARLKYLVADWGLARFREEIETRLGRKLQPPRGVEVFGYFDHVGWFEQGDGRWSYGVPIENGRIADTNRSQLKTAVREILRTCEAGAAVTAQQNLLLTDVPFEHRAVVEGALHRNDAATARETSAVRRHAMACVALPRCSMAATESERVLPGLLDQLEPELNKLGLADEEFTLRMTGCSNGCSRPYVADVGLVGRSVGRYAIHLGGRMWGDRLGFLYLEEVPLEQLAPTLARVFAFFSRHRAAEESLGDFCHRLGREKLLAACES